jgi:hypothetical protein
MITYTDLEKLCAKLTKERNKLLNIFSDYENVCSSVEHAEQEFQKIRKRMQCLEDELAKEKLKHIIPDTKELIPEMDEDGYPTDEDLKIVQNWEPTDFHGLAIFLTKAWIYKDYINLNGSVLEISTGGWSGHEELINAIPAMWKYFHFWSNRRGGHYVFTYQGHNPDKLLDF